jgi:hypothetical protein
VVKGEWTRIHNEELRDLYSPNIIRVIKKNEMGRTCGSCGRQERERVLVGRLEGKTALGRSRLRLKYNIKIDVTEVGWSMDWFYLAQDMETWRAVVNTVMNLWVL